MSDEAFTDMCNAFQRLIDAHCQIKSPFHNPVNADAMVALRTLRALRAQLAAAEARAERYRHLLADIKQWDISQFMSIPHLLRERMQSALAEGDAG